jgi:nicotinamidase/pyrazinamidase
LEGRLSGKCFKNCIAACVWDDRYGSNLLQQTGVAVGCLFFRLIKFIMYMKTLIICDVQNDFLSGGSLEVPAGNEIIPVINRIQRYFELVIATQDWHPPNHISFASNHRDKRPFDNIEWQGMKQTLWPDHCVQGSSGAEFHPELEMNKAEAIFRKGMDSEIDSYSGFYDNGHKKDTGLAGYLLRRGSKELFICGLAADVCVWYSIVDACKIGFSVVLVEDATKPIDEKEFVNIKQEMQRLGVKIITSTDLQDVL